MLAIRSMPTRSDLPGDLSRKKFLKALKRLGFTINRVGGKGPHVKIECPVSNKIITVPGDLRKDVLYYVLKEIERYSDITWENIKEEL